MGKLLFVNFSQLRSFYVVGQELSFTRAAKVLNIGQPTLTVQVRALEKQYNVALFHRSPRGLQFTEAGEALFAVARQIFRLEEEAVEILSTARDELSGKLRVGTVGPSFVMKLLARFSGHYPLVQVSITSDNSDIVLQRILDFSLDVAVVGDPGPDPRLVSLRLGSHEVMLFVNQAHPWAGKHQISLQHLDGQRLIMREPGSMTRRALEDVLSKEGVRPKVVMEVSREAVREAVLEGLGIGIVSEAEIRPDKELRPFRIADHKAFTQSHLICLKSRMNTRAVSAFMRTAGEWIDLEAGAIRP